MIAAARTWATLGYLLLVLLLGGASAAGYGSNIALQLGGCALIGWVLWSEPPSTGIRTGLATFLLAIVVVALIQFIPLPPALWTRLPGRAAIAAGFDLAGMTVPWLPLSLDPWGTLQSLVWWLPAFAVLLAFRSPKAPTTRHAVWVIGAIAYVSVGLGLVQALSGAGYLYSITNRGNAVGFFANSNHLGSFLLVAMVLIAAQWLHDRPTGARSRARASTKYVLPALLIPLAIGIIFSNSLAAMLLMIPTIGGLLLIQQSDIRIRWPLVGLTIIMFGAGLVWLLASGFVANDLMTKSGTAGISRGEFLTNGLQMLREFAPTGSGLGTFREIYPWYENPALIGTTYVNHAHNDLLELLIETGLFGLILLGLFLRWFAVRTWRLWSENRTVNPLALGATLGTAAVLTHSLVDYPLRTAAVSSVIALCCAIMTRSPDARGAEALAGEGAGSRETMMKI